MKVAFIISPKGKEKNSDLILRIYKYIISLGYTHTTDFAKKVDPKEFYSKNSKQAETFFSSYIKYISLADICVFEVSNRSLAIGHLVQVAMNFNKPIVALYLDEKPLFLSKVSYSRLQIVKYDETEVRDLLRDALDAAKEMTDIRFNMLLSPAHFRFLDAKAKESKASKATIIRQLLEKEIRGGMRK